jgi:hypothetical protein
VAENPKQVLGSKRRDPSLHPKSQHSALLPASQSVKQGLGSLRNFPLFSAGSIHEAALRTGQRRRHLQQLEPTAYFGRRCQLLTQHETNWERETQNDNHKIINKRYLTLSVLKALLFISYGGKGNIKKFKLLNGW